MDETRFDDLSRRLGAAATRRAGLKAALGVLLGGAGIAAGMEADAKNRRKRCRPACGAAQACVDRQCTCPNGGTVCGPNCCLTSQACENGRCVAMPDPGACVAFGQACKNVGVPCCEGLVCGSGQGGEGDVACYVPAGGACATTRDCTFGSQCLSGQCVANPQPQPTPTQVVPACTPTVTVTGNPETDGAAFITAFDAAKTQTDPVIYLGSGDYLIAPEAENGVEWDVAGKTVKVQACPGAEAIIRGTMGGSDAGDLFTITAGTIEFDGPGLSIVGETENGNGTRAIVLAAPGPVGVVLRDVVVADHYRGVHTETSNPSAQVQIFGGSVSALYRLYWRTNGSFTCDPNILPGTGVCQCDGGGCSGCCAVWTS